MTYEEAINAIPRGIYHHYKGGTYEVLSIAQYSEDDYPPVVIYRKLLNTGPLLVRPAETWNETIIDNGFAHKRFVKI